MQNADGWLDVRGFSDLTIYAKATGQNSNVRVLKRVHTRDSDDSDVLQAAVLVTAGAGKVAIYEGKATNVAFIKLQHEGATATGGTTDVMVLMKGVSPGV